MILSRTHSWKLLRSPFWRNIQLIVAAALGAAAIYAATVDGSDFGLFGSHGVDKPMKISARNEVGKENNVALGKLEAEFTAAFDGRRPTWRFRLSTGFMLSPMAG